MNLQRLEYFLVTAEEMNFTKAAERLFISQQALSSYIKRLEEEYDVKLFDRKPTLHLTQEGEQMVFYGKQMLLSDNNLKAAFADIQNEYRGNIKFGISRLRARIFFPEIWDIFNSSHPNISLELVDGNSSIFADMLEDGKLDLYVGVNIAERVGVKVINLAAERINCCFHKKLLKEYYPDTYEELLDEFSRDGVNLSKLSACPLLTLLPGNRIRNTLDQYYNDKKKPYIKLSSNQQQLLYELAKGANGVAIISPVIPYSHREDAVKNDDFYVFNVTKDMPQSSFSLAMRTDYRPPQYIQHLRQTIEYVCTNYSKKYWECI